MVMWINRQVFYLNLSLLNKNKDLKFKKDTVSFLFHHEFYHIIDAFIIIIAI